MTDHGASCEEDRSLRGAYGVGDPRAIPVTGMLDRMAREQQQCTPRAVEPALPISATSQLFNNYVQTCDFSGFFPLILGFFTNLPLPQKERSSLYRVQTSSFWFMGMWRVCKSSKIKHPGGSGGGGALSSRPKVDPGPLPIFQDLLLLSNHTPVCYIL